jgi:surface-anchored protein
MLSRITFASLAVLSITSVSVAAAPISEDHVDVAVGWDGFALEPHWHQEDLGLEFEPDEAFVVGALPAIAVTGSPGFGIPGAFYAFPESEIAGLPFLGIGAEEVPTGAFVGNTLSLKLTGITGPAGGRFWLYRTSTSPFTPFDLLLDSTDLSKSFNITAGSHGHANWAFNLPGEYGLTFEWSGNTVPGGGLEAPVSASGTFTFVVAPEPGLLTMGLSAGALLLARRRRA